MDALESIRDAAWLYVAAPLLALAALWLTIRLGAPQLTRLPAAFRALRAGDPEAEGDVPPGASTWLATAATLGAASTVGAATAVALGGAGVIAWVWLFALLIAPLRFAEALLARTRPPGRSGVQIGSLSVRLSSESGPMRVLGFLLFGCILVAAFAFVGGVHGAALVDASEQLLPGSMPLVGFGVAALAAALALGGMKRTGSIGGWLALAAVTVLIGTAGWAALSEPGRALGSIGRAFGETFGGAPTASPFVGAFAGEIAMAALLYALPPVGATTGMAGALHGSAQARTTRGQAAAALLGPLTYAVLTTVLCAAFVATGAYYRRVEDRRPLSEVKIYVTPFESASQRAEGERLHSGYMRIDEGEPRDIGLSIGTDRGMVQNARWLYRGEPANIALHLRGGEPFRILLPGEGILREAQLSETDEVVIEGEMLPRGGGLLASALTRGTGGEVGPRLALGALFVLLAVGAAAWGMGAARSLRAGAPPWARVAIGVLPAAGLALASSGAAPWLAALGGIAAAAAVTITVLALVLKSKEAAGLGG